MVACLWSDHHCGSGLAWQTSNVAAMSIQWSSLKQLMIREPKLGWIQAKKQLSTLTVLHLESALCTRSFISAFFRPHRATSMKCLVKKQIYEKEFSSRKNFSPFCTALHASYPVLNVCAHSVWHLNDAVKWSATHALNWKKSFVD